MSGVANSFGGFLGLSGGPQVGVSNQAQDMQTGQLSDLTSPGWNDVMSKLGRGIGDYQSALGQASTAAERNDIATNPLTGSAMATGQVESNPLFQSTFNNANQSIGQGNQLVNQGNQLFNSDVNQLGQNQGYLDTAQNKEQDLQNQGFKLQPQDIEAYGQASGDISRMFGAQGNQAANDLAMRGLSSAPSGAAGATFSGLAGNQNEMLAKAQMDIANQRMQNTMQRIGQQQNFVNSLQGNQNNLRGQAANTNAQTGGINAQTAGINQSLGNFAGQQVQDQFGRNLAGVQNYQGMLGGTASGQNAANQGYLASAQFGQANKPKNIGDVGIGAATQGAGAAGTQGGQQLGSSLFAAG